jgi:hypothetical protein
MQFSPASLAAINCAIFSGIAIGSVLNEGNLNSWTVVLSILGALTNIVVWRHFNVKELTSHKLVEAESATERKRLMKELSEEAERRRELDRIERN